MVFTPCSQIFFRLQTKNLYSFFFILFCFVSSDVVAYVSIHKTKQTCIEQQMTANFVVLLGHVSIWRTQNV